MRKHRNEGLDAEQDYVQIARNLALYDFPWDTLQALSFALFRTYAVPSVGNLLDRTRAFGDETQKRYDDTTILLEVPLVEGFDSVEGKAALRRINQMHRMYDISNDDMVYVLSTFVVVPVRWIQRYGWRRITDVERDAMVRYYREMGRHMAIREMPETYEGFERLMEDYEAAHFAYDEGAARVAAATLELLASFYPRPFRRGVMLFSRGLMDETLIEAFGLREPGRLVRWLADASLRLRGRFVALLPRRRKPKLLQDMPRIKSYPAGFVVEEMGTFVPGCPVPHRAAKIDRTEPSSQETRAADA